MSSSYFLKTEKFLCSYIGAAGRHTAQFSMLERLERCLQCDRLAPVHGHRGYQRSDLLARDKQIVNLRHVLILQTLGAREERTQFVLRQSCDRCDRRLGYAKTGHAIGKLISPNWTERCHIDDILLTFRKLKINCALG